MCRSEPSSTAEIQRLLQILLRYLSRHPEAKDSIEGIHRWWLPQGGLDWRKQQLEDALDILVAKEWVVDKDLGGRTVYSLRGDRSGDVLSFLRSLEEAGTEGTGDG